MPPKPYAEVLAEARRLAPDEQQQLIRALAEPLPQTNGDAPADADKVRSLYDALQARGLIGCLKDAPPDLSTNPKYMEGFGQHAE